MTIFSPTGSTDESYDFHSKARRRLSPESRFNARYWMLETGALGRPRGMVWGGRREEGSGWGTHVYLWQIHFDIWQNQYNIVKLSKIKFNKNRMKKQNKKYHLNLLIQ